MDGLKILIKKNSQFIFKLLNDTFLSQNDTFDFRFVIPPIATNSYILPLINLGNDKNDKSDTFLRKYFYKTL